MLIIVELRMCDKKLSFLRTENPKYVKISQKNQECLKLFYVLFVF